MAMVVMWCIAVGTWQGNGNGSDVAGQGIITGSDVVCSSGDM
jgi:hypothetical protein